MENSITEIEAPEAAKQTQGSTENQQQDTSTTMTENQNTASEQVADSESQTTQENLSAVLAPKEFSIPEELEPATSPVDGDQLAREIAQFIDNHCILPGGSINAVVLWVISSYLINAFRVFPKLTLISPEKRCGKTTTMEVIKVLCRDALLTSNVSPAAIYRLTKLGIQPTLLIDEADTYVKGGDKDLIGILNSSHTRSAAYVIRCTGDEHTPETYSTWMPMVLASIGDLGPTLMDRSIVVNLRRKKPGESAKALTVDAFDHYSPLRQKILRWCIDHRDTVASSETLPPYAGNDRAVDNWMPLFRVAETLGGDWLTNCEKIYHHSTDAQELELPTQLLSDLRAIWASCADDRITTEEIISKLREDTLKPWGSCDNGKPINARSMSTLLKPYGIKPKVLRFSSQTRRGYERNQFDDAFERYLQ